MIVQRVALAALVVSGMTSAGDASASGCPSEAQVRASIVKHINTVDWSPARLEIYRVKSVGNFKFGPMRIGKTYGDICPLRIEYSYEVVKSDGTRSITKGGENKTHLFYQDSFNDWIFKVGSNT